MADLILIFYPLFSLGCGVLGGAIMWRTSKRKAARRIWDDFGGECGNDQDYCRWTGDEKTVGKCYCQEVAWRHARLAIEGKKP